MNNDDPPKPSAPVVASRGRDTRLDPIDDPGLASFDETQPGVPRPVDVRVAAEVLPARSAGLVRSPSSTPLVASTASTASTSSSPDRRSERPATGGSALRSEPVGSDGLLLRPPRLRTGWPFLPLAPVLVVVVGLGVAFAIGLVGLDQLSRAGDDHAGTRAELLAATVAARLGVLPPGRRVDVTQLVARRSAAELLVVSARGEIIHDQTLGAPDPAALRKMLATRSGVAEMRMGRAHYAVRPIGPPSDPNAPRLVVLVPEPRAAVGANALAGSLAALAVLLLGVAASVAYAVSRDVTRDVEFVTHRVRTMAQVRTEPTGELIPARTMDEVGILTATFNKLVGRFGIASGRYRGDLTRASAADRERAAFLAAVSHELRSPLNAILGFADILMEEVDGPLSASAREEVEQIRGSGAHLLALINDILELSALESGQLRLARSDVDVFALANEVMREAKGLVGEKSLDVGVEGEKVIARVDARRVRQILGNLVNNAIKFTQRGEVRVSVRADGARVVIVVRDTGPGISQQERAMIFDEYKQGRSERPRRRGTGLGLAIARRLVLLHRGSISVESEIGHGSTFEVSLPIGAVDAAAVPPRASEPGASPNAREGSA